MYGFSEFIDSWLVKELKRGHEVGIEEVRSISKEVPASFRREPFIL